MKLIKEGKTKNVYALPDGNYLLKLKDDATGKDGKFDPGENQVGLSIEGLGKKSLELTRHYFEKLNALGVPTHYVESDPVGVTMTVRPAEFFGNGGLELICRLRAVGSFYKRYGGYVKEGEKLDYLVEFTLKDDGRGDPPASKSTLVELGICTEAEAETLRALTKKITAVIREDLADNGVELYDIKLEFGKVNGEIALIDEISGGTMRCYHNGRLLAPTEINGFVIK